MIDLIVAWMIDHGTQMYIPEGLPGVFKEQRNDGKTSHGTREHEPVLRNAGTTKPLLIFFDVDVDAGGMRQVDMLNREQIRNKDPPSPERCSFSTSHALLVYVANASICIVEVFMELLYRFLSMFSLWHKYLSSLYILSISSNSFQPYMKESPL